MPLRPNLFSRIAHSLAHSRSDIILSDSWFRGGNAVLLERKVFVATHPARCVACPQCTGFAEVCDAFGTCSECGHVFPVSSQSLLRYKFSHDGMAKLLAEELHLDHWQKKDGYDSFRSQNSRSVYYVHREGDVDLSRLLGANNQMLIFGSASPAPAAKAEVCDIGSVFEIGADGSLVVAPNILGWTEVMPRRIVAMSKKDEPMKARQAELGRWLERAVRRLSHRKADLGRQYEKTCCQRFLDTFKKLHPDYTVSLKTISNDVKALCAGEPDFRMCWKALISGKVEAAGKAAVELDRKPNSRFDNASFMRLEAKSFPGGGYADCEVDPQSVLPVEDEDSFYAEIDRLMDSRQ